MPVLTRAQIKGLADEINRLRSIAIRKYGKAKVDSWRQERLNRLPVTYESIFGEE